MDLDGACGMDFQGGHSNLRLCIWLSLHSVVSCESATPLIWGTSCLAGMLPGDSSNHGNAESGSYNLPHNRIEKHSCIGSTWYLNRREIEDNSPSRRDGIDLKKESYLRKSYCTFLQDLGMRLKVPQVTIATAIIFCHRFFLRQSHAKNDRRTVATVCMFLAGKVEETPRPLKDVIIVSYEIIHKKDPVAVQRIKQQREVYEQQKELILLGERVVLATLGFDFNVHHPYKPLVEAIKKFKVAQNALAQVAWNFVNDGLRTSLCLQFKPHHIAAGAIFLAAKFLKVKLPSDGEKVWWQEFDVTPRQLEEVSNQMLELYEQNRAATGTTGNEVEGSLASASSHRVPTKPHASAEESGAQNSHSQVGGPTSSKPVNPAPLRPVSEQSTADGQRPSSKITLDGHDHSGREQRSTSWEYNTDSSKDQRHHESGSAAEPSNGKTIHGSERQSENPGRSDIVGKVEGKDRNLVYNEVNKGSPVDAIKMFDKDKLKAAIEKRRKARPDVSKKADVMDDDDLIERELENGVELAIEDEKIKHEKRGYGHGQENGIHRTEPAKEVVEEGELSFDGRYFESPDLGSRKRKRVSPDGHMDGKGGYDVPWRNQHAYSKHRENVDDVAAGRGDDLERDHRKYG